ncbi:MAG TPA: hypothetical protein VG268_15400 [Streptosporangiaceae bacterium]|nr:hypothetical protein [Streptosporangiaceae bacterium]
MSPLTGVLREAWAMYRRFAAHFLLIAFVLYIISAAIAALLSLAGAGGAFAALIINFFFTFLLQAALVKAVQDVRDGRVDLNFGETVRAALPYLLPVAGASILAAIGIAIGFILIIIPGLILLTYWSLIVPTIVLGGTPAMGSFGQSWRTVRGYFWNVFGTYVLVFLIYLVFEIVLSLIFAALPGAGRGFIASVVSGTLVAPFLAIVVSLIYYRLTAAHQGTMPTGYGAPGYGEPAYPPPPPGGYGGGGYGNVPGYDAPPAGYGNQPGANPPPPSYGSSNPSAPNEPARDEPTPPSDPWGNATRADTPPPDGGPGGSYTRPDNEPPA